MVAWLIYDLRSDPEREVECFNACLGCSDQVLGLALYSLWPWQPIPTRKYFVFLSLLPYVTCFISHSPSEGSLPPHRYRNSCRYSYQDLCQIYDRPRDVQTTRRPTSCCLPALALIMARQHRHCVSVSPYSVSFQDQNNP